MSQTSKTLPFDNDEKHQRKYTCFVCGVMFQEFTKYRDHIVEKHEEGREYIKCPLEYCGAPVRDLRAHFRVKHPSQKMPEQGMAAASVWKDFNEKKSRTKKPKFREGWYDSTKMRKQLHYRSGYEAKVYECLDADNDVIGFDVEPFEIAYIHRGEPHKYIPDIIIRFLDGRTEIWEIKPTNQTMLDKNKAKWIAAERECKSRGWGFQVITEVGIDKLRMKVKKQFMEANIGR